MPKTDIVNYETIIVLPGGIHKYVIFVEDERGCEIMLHRTDGPAFIDNFNCLASWYLFGEVIVGTRDYCMRLHMDDETTCMWLLKYGETLSWGCEHV